MWTILWTFRYSFDCRKTISRPRRCVCVCVRVVCVSVRERERERGKRNLSHPTHRTCPKPNTTPTVISLSFSFSLWHTHLHPHSHTVSLSLSLYRALLSDSYFSGFFLEAFFIVRSRFCTTHSNSLFISCGALSKLLHWHLPNSWWNNSLQPIKS